MKKIYLLLYITLITHLLTKGATKDTSTPLFNNSCPLIKKPCLKCIKTKALLAGLNKKTLSPFDKKALLDKYLDLQKSCSLCFKQPSELSLQESP